MVRTFQTISQFLFLLLFFILLTTGRIQLWMVIFLSSVILALALGRFYCGWICPINTVMKAITKVKKRLRIKNLAIPQFVKKPLFRYGLLAAFLATMFLVLAGGKKLPVLPALVLAGAAVTLFLPESLWHRYLCPYGAILNLTGSKALKRVRIETNNCLQCGLCQKVCPAAAVSKAEKYTIDGGLCLTCLECVSQCPKKAIKYQ